MTILCSGPLVLATVFTPTIPTEHQMYQWLENQSWLTAGGEASSNISNWVHGWPADYCLIGSANRGHRCNIAVLGIMILITRNDWGLQLINLGFVWQLLMLVSIFETVINILFLQIVINDDWKPTWELWSSQNQEAHVPGRCGRHPVNSWRPGRWQSGQGPIIGRYYSEHQRHVKMYFELYYANL